MRDNERFMPGSGLLAAGLLLALGMGAAPAAGLLLECTLIIDASSGEALSRKGTCDQGFAPASTFKVPLALMGFDSGVLKDPKTPSWDYRPEFNANKRQQKTVNPTIWLEDSIVWYSQQITQQIGDERFADYVAKFNYGNMDVSGDPGKNNGLTHSWLMSSLKISPVEQVRFIRAMLDRQLALSAKAYDMTETIMPRFAIGGGWIVHGKTGSGRLREKNDVDGKVRPVGWFVGWAKKDGRRVAFARLEIGNGKADKRPGFQAREALFEALSKLDLD
ncbi:class D beta-lactamase [Mesorhizobium sp. L-8-3]|uniref:class D beta-lactamase n=1 Tax=Mesorhizobium sp. L-8-3 TaxID=2744522 RepID=UPI0019280387|nr:class D beta-lactamase [Mesorhizobium sp. L-8-3]BCH23741.1 beta-lactamase [Mesorhizobium sp. L-8-3]